MRVVGVLIGISIALSAVASPLVPGAPVPPLQINGPERGLLKRGVGASLTYQPFDSRRVIPGKVRVTIHMAARPGAKSDGQRLTDALAAAKLDPSQFQVLVVLAGDDCIFGTCFLVRGQFEDQVREHRATVFVYDDQGEGRARWGLPRKAFTALLTDRDGRIVRAKSGVFSAADAQAYLREIRALMNP